MNIYNKFIEGLEHKNRIKNILNEDINDKLLSNKVRKKSLNSLLSTRPELKDNINKIKLKYGYSEEQLEQQNLHHQISQLKNKYIKNNTNQYKINNVNIISYTSNNPNKQNNKNIEFQKTHTQKYRNQSLDFEKVKNISLPYNTNNNVNNLEKKGMSFCLSSDRLVNDINNSNFNLSNNIDNSDKKGKNYNYQKYIKNQRNEFNNIDQKIKEILEDKYLSPEKVQKFNNIHPISKRINMLTNLKKEINIINKNANDNNINNINNSFFSQLSYGSYTTVGFNYIKPRIKRPSLYEDIISKNNDSKNNFFINEISKDNELAKPVLIKNLQKPNVNILHFPSFCRMNKDN